MENVDELEIRKFEALAARWWDPNSEFRPLHEINPLRLNFHGANVTAIDMADASLSVAKLHQLESGLDINYRKISAEALSEEAPQRFDVVTCLEMLEHVPTPESVIRACHNLVKPGGTVVFSTINRNPKSYVFAILGAEYILQLLPRGTHEYARFIKPSELAAWARGAGLDLNKQIGMGYNPLTKRYFLQKNVDVNYLALYSRPAL